MSLVLEFLILFVEGCHVLSHHADLGLIVLGDDIFVCFGCFQFLVKLCESLLMLALDLVQLFLPFSIFFHDLEAATLAELVHTLHLLRHLTQLLQGFLLQQK